MLIFYNPGLLDDSDQNIITDAIDWLRKDAGGALGFIPRKGIEDAIRRGRVLICTEPEYDPDAIGGWIVWCKNRETLRILGVSVPEDYRMQGRGRRLLEAILRDPASRKTTRIELRCREDLDANHFWKACGFELQKTVKGRNKTGKQINIYTIEGIRCDGFTFCTSTKSSLTQVTTSERPETSETDFATTQQAEEPD